ncbi:MAG: hypothetical protein ACLS2X_00955 [Coprococcus sp.]
MSLRCNPFPDIIRNATNFRKKFKDIFNSGQSLRYPRKSAPLRVVIVNRQGSE